jgi:hypothetical protein
MVMVVVVVVVEGKQVRGEKVVRTRHINTDPKTLKRWRMAQELARRASQHYEVTRQKHVVLHTHAVPVGPATNPPPPSEEAQRSSPASSPEAHPFAGEDATSWKCRLSHSPTHPHTHPHTQWQEGTLTAAILSVLISGADD